MSCFAVLGEPREKWNAKISPSHRQLKNQDLDDDALRTTRFATEALEKTCSVTQHCVWLQSLLSQCAPVPLILTGISLCSHFSQTSSPISFSTFGNDVSLAVWWHTVFRQEAVVLQDQEGSGLTGGVLEARSLHPSVVQT